MTTPRNPGRVLRAEEMNVTEEASRIQGRALDGQTSVVRLGQFVFCSTETGDAWMLDPEEGHAVCLAHDFEARRIPIRETPSRLAIEWRADYRIEGEAFTVAEREGSGRTILGYPTAEIQHLSSESPAPLREDSSDPDRARERLKTGRNDPCPCGSGKKYKRCCLAKDEELMRQSDAEGEAWTDEPAETDIPATGDTSGADAEDKEFSDSADSIADIDTDLPTEAERKVDALWDECETRERPTVEQMDTLLANLLVLPPEASEWSELFHRFARHNHPDLPGVFRRIAASVPHTNETGMAFFYWAAADEFVRRQYPHLLPEVAAGWRKLDVQTYDADGLSHVEDYLLAEGFEAETLELAEHFLPIQRADGGLMPYVVPELCELIFELRVGRPLRSGPSSATEPDLLAEELRRGIEAAEVHPDAARNAADVIAGRTPVRVWARPHFKLVTGDIRTDDRTEGGQKGVRS